MPGGLQAYVQASLIKLPGPRTSTAAQRKAQKAPGSTVRKPQTDSMGFCSRCDTFHSQNCTAVRNVRYGRCTVSSPVSAPTQGYRWKCVATLFSAAGSGLVPA